MRRARQFPGMDVTVFTGATTRVTIDIGGGIAARGSTAAWSRRSSAMRRTLLAFLAVSAAG